MDRQSWSIVVVFVLVGRSRELGLLRSEWAHVARSRPRLVLVEGPAGIGKTKLVRKFLADIDVGATREALGDEIEAEVPYATVEQLFPEIATTDPPSLTVADPVTVGSRLVDAVGDLQVGGPVVLAVDDAHWADPLSLHALLFCFRRLHVDRVLVVVSSRSTDGKLPAGLARLVDGDRGRRIELGGLDAGGLGDLAQAVGAQPLSRHQLRRLAEHTGGNPLYAGALLRELSPSDWGSPVKPLPAPRSFAENVNARLARCTEATRCLVQAAVVVGGDAPIRTVAAVAALDEPAKSVDEALVEDLLLRRGQPPEVTVRPSHPLVGSAVYQSLDTSEQVRLHQAAAIHATDVGTRLRHRVAATLSTDDALAAELADYARNQGARGAFASAAVAMANAGHITASPDEKEDRLLAAAEFYLAAGDVASAADLLQRVEPLHWDARRRWLQGWLALSSGRYVEAEARLRQAWNTAVGQQSVLRGQVAAQMATILMFQGRADEFSTWATRAIDSQELRGPMRFIWYVSTGLHVLVGRTAEAFAMLTEASTEPLTPAAEGATVARGVLRMLVDDLDGARMDLEAVLAASRRHGVTQTAFVTLGNLAELEYRAGRWDDGRMHADLAVALAEATDFAHDAPYLNAIAAAIPGRRGDWQAAYARLGEAQRTAHIVGVPAALAYVATAAAIVEHSRMHPPGVLTATDEIASLVGHVAGPDRPGVLGWQELRAEALARTGRTGEAHVCLSHFEELASELDLDSALAAAARVRGLLAAGRGDREVAVEAFKASLGHYDQVDLPFERGLAHLYYGQFLRRIGSRRDAVDQLRRSDEVFRRLRARPFMAITDKELSACGLNRQRSETSESPILTPQEDAVARLVARGLSNKEVAAELVLSVKTVEFHLSRVYSKLGLRSRTQLAVRLHT